MEYGIKFARGWIIADQEFFGSNEPQAILERLPSYFTAVRAGSSFFFCHDASLAATVKEYPDFTVIFIGIAYDIRDGRIFSAPYEICEDIHTSFSFEKDFSQNTAFLELADNLAGRFAILLIRGNRILALNDCSGLRAIYYHIYKTAIASSYGLIALYSPEPAVNHYQELYREHSLLKQPVPRSLWGDQSPYASIRLLVPNHCLQLPEHKIERFFPRSVLEPVSLQDAASYLASSLKQIMNRLNQDFNIYLSLTAGMDSRTTLAACKEIKDDIILFSYYYDGHKKEAYQDFHCSLAFCRKISLLYDIRHREMRLTGLKLCPEEKEEMLANTYIAPHEGELAFFRQAFNDHKSINVRSNMYEIIKSNRWDIFPDYPDEKVARIMTMDSMISSASRYYKDAQEYYLNYIKQYKIRNVIDLGYNYGDLFYTEFRGAIWLSSVYAEPDSVIESFTPINCRNLIKTALAIPQEIKDKNMLQYEIITKLWPELLSDYKYPNITCPISNLADYIDFPESIEIDYLKEHDKNKNIFIKSYNHSISQRNNIDFKKINYNSILFGFNNGKLYTGDTVELTYKRHIRANTRYRLSFDLLIRHSKYNSAFNIDYEIWLNGEKRCRESIAKFQGFNQFIYIGIPKTGSELILTIKIINLEQTSSIFNNSVLKLSNLAFCEEHELLFDDYVILTSPLLKKAYELIQKMNGADLPEDQPQISGQTS